MANNTYLCKCGYKIDVISIGDIDKEVVCLMCNRKAKLMEKRKERKCQSTIIQESKKETKRVIGKKMKSKS